MPCYTAWNEYLTPDTPEYLRAKEIVRAKLNAVKHIVNYYYKAHEGTLPTLPDGTLIDPFRQPRSSKEMAIREAICHHFACDGIHFCTLYDVCTLLDSEVREDQACLAVILPCATLMRTELTKFNPSFSSSGDV